MKRHTVGVSTRQKEFIKEMEPLTRSRQPWEVWTDFVTMAGCSISNALDRREPIRESREQLYLQSAKKYKPDELNRFIRMLAIITEALEEEPCQDFLGSLFMLLELGNHWKGQFFTPISVCRCMSALNMVDAKAHIERKGWFSVSDPCCGGGAMLIATVDALVAEKVDDWQMHVQFVAQDVDFIACMMTYIQISLLGCPGYVIWGNTLVPDAGLEADWSNVWFTPLYFHKVWVWRRAFHRMEDMIRTEPQKTETVEITESGSCAGTLESAVFFFFEQEESQCWKKLEKTS